MTPIQVERAIGVLFFICYYSLLVHCNYVAAMLHFWKSAEGEK